MAVEIPGYKIIRVLGKGGMATVYLAVQEIFEREVALKVMSKGLADDPAFGQRFLREARIVSQLDHPNIVTVFDVGSHDGTFFLSMEYIKGEEVKVAYRNMPFMDKIQVIRDMASALNYAGEKGYVHRDIKPENIMIREEDGRAVLMDFGIARATEAEISVTQTGTAIGTPHYMSPEQAKGLAVDARSDLYSLGVVFFMIMVGHVPYDGESAVAIGIKHITEPVPDFPPHLGILQYILGRLMAKKPADRFQTGGEVIIAIDNLDLGAQAAKIEKFIEENEGDLSSSLDTPTELHTDFSYNKAEYDVDEDPTRFTLSFESVDEPPKQSTRWPLVAGLAVVACLIGGYSIWDFSSKKHVASDQGQQSSVQSSIAKFVGLSGKDQGLNLDGVTDQRLLKLQKDINDFEDRYKANAKFLPDLVGKYRELEKSLPENPSIKRQITRLANQQAGLLKPLIDSGDFKQAQSSYELSKKLFPDFQSSDLDKQKKRLLNRSEIQSHLDKALSQYKKGRLTLPENEGALDYYLKVLAIDNEMIPAKLGVEKILTDLVGRAHKQYRRGKVDQAHATLERVLSVNPKFEQGLILQRKFEKTGVRTEELKALFDKAEKYLEKGQLYSPEGENAYVIYQKIIAVDGGNQQAQRGMKKLHEALSERAQEFVSLGDYEAAKSSLIPASRWRNDEGEFQLLILSVDEAIAEHKYRTSQP